MSVLPHPVMALHVRWVLRPPSQKKPLLHVDRVERPQRSPMLQVITVEPPVSQKEPLAHVMMVAPKQPKAELQVL